MLRPEFVNATLAAVQLRIDFLHHYTCHVNHVRHIFLLELSHALLHCKYAHQSLNHKIHSLPPRLSHAPELPPKPIGHYFSLTSLGLFPFRGLFIFFCGLLRLLVRRLSFLWHLG